ncbi:hypothetical protein VKT23_014679 [Stygiomarasmius scandens]|uniref:Uncharacterized protein n=1 Tax=Marasmiellus scandens TaxID=2682957 RepID=A0ABR1J0C1_9AGAR
MKNLLVSDKVSRHYQIYNWGAAHTAQLVPAPTSLSPRSRQLNENLPVTKAIFCTLDSVVGGSKGKAFLWNTEGRRLADLLTPDDGDSVVSDVACGYDYSLATPRLATAIDSGRTNKITLWEAVGAEEARTIEEPGSSASSRFPDMNIAFTAVAAIPAVLYLVANQWMGGQLL